MIANLFEYSYKEMKNPDEDEGDSEKKYKFYIVLEMGDCSLEQYVKDIHNQGDTIGLIQIIEFFSSILEIGKCLKDLGISHNDYKLSNFLIFKTLNGVKIKLTDFGTCRKELNFD